jgi:spermidine synthase
VGLPCPENTGKVLVRSALLLAFSLLLVLPLMQLLSVETVALKPPIIRQLVSFGAVYLVIAIPFFLAGLMTTILMATYPQHIRRLYFWDLTGAGLGCVLVAPLLPAIGPNGILLCAAALALFAAGFFSKSRGLGMAIPAIGLLLFAFLIPEKYFPFLDDVTNKYSQVGNPIEFNRWDPVSKINVVNVVKNDAHRGDLKKISYDGGRQNSSLIPFDGNFKRLRENIDLVQDHFINFAVIASHYLKRDTNQQVLNIGSAGGNEVKAALMYGAAHVDAVELVPTVVELVKNQYAEYIGLIFEDPRVNVHAREGRSFLRGIDKKYDIIQIFSNHTTSSIASGTGAMATGYLWTVEAFREYFEHLTENGVLQINQLIYPRLVTAAAAAWKEMGRSDFQRHVVVIQLGNDDWQPSFFVKNKPWTESELNELRTVFTQFPNRHQEERGQYRLIENPLDPSSSFLSQEFYSGKISNKLDELMEYRITPATDDRPYFIFVRETWMSPRMEPDSSKFLNPEVASLLNRMRIGENEYVPKDTLHLIMTGAASLFYAVIFIVVPLRFSKVGTARWSAKESTLAYFACLGSGFIILELVLIQIFMHFIGNPLYTYSTTLFCLLLGAGLGSLYSDKLNISLTHRWAWPFLGILIIGTAFILTRSQVFYFFLGEPMWIRILISASLMIPFGFFLGIPFPLGILALEKNASTAIPWAWGLNGFFTVVGGLASVLLSLFLGFTAAFFVALTIYALAFAMFSRMRRAALT